MTRPIKFRAWNGARMITNAPNLMLDSRGIPYWQFGFEEPEPMSDTVLMQFTGLLDRHGKEIYEGDIVLNFGDIHEHTDKYWEIYFSNGSFWMKTLNQISITTIKKIPVNSQLENNYVEVIGNIYENPNLLK